MKHSEPFRSSLAIASGECNDITKQIPSAMNLFGFELAPKKTVYHAVFGQGTVLRVYRFVCVVGFVKDCCERAIPNFALFESESHADAAVNFVSAYQSHVVRVE